MQSRRDFLDTMAMGAGAAWLARMAFGAMAEEGAPGLSGLLEVLEKVGKPGEVVTNPDGTRVLLLPYGGRVLGLFAAGNEENFYWTNPALASAETARKFYAGKEWQNSGGDRTWLAPEVDIFLPKFPDTSVYWQPRELDPGKYNAVAGKHGVRLVNHLTLKMSRSGKPVSLCMSKSVGPAPNPLRYEKGLDVSGLSYAGYTQYTSLEITSVKEAPPVGLWNLVQMPHGGELLIPTFSKTTPKIWFGEISAEDLNASEHLIRYRMRAQGEHKMGVRAVATTGRVGYLYGAGEQCALIVRNYSVNPSGEYVDAPWKDPGDLGYSTQACNVNSKLGSFSELEYHIPAIGGDTGVLRCDDAAQIWAFRGPEETIKMAARCLLSPEI